MSTLGLYSEAAWFYLGGYSNTLVVINNAPLNENKFDVWCVVLYVPLELWGPLLLLNS
jgi:hypothetical protein